MIGRVEAGKPAQITFTCDYHELVTGDMHPGGPLHIRYDPKRIVPENEGYMFGDPQRPIVAHARFRDEAQSCEQLLSSPVGILAHPDVDITGQGSMLTTVLDVPEDADRVTLWFSYRSQSGDTRYDSDYGADYCFGFLSRHIDVLAATVADDPQTAGGRFALDVSAVAPVDGVWVRYFVIGERPCVPREVSLYCTNTATPSGRVIWSLPSVAVPGDCVVRFRIVYRLDGRYFNDDNAGHYYLAPCPAPDPVPPLPRELAEAALAWR